MNRQPSSQTVEFEIKGNKVILDAEDAYLLEGKNWHLANGYPRTMSKISEDGCKKRKAYYLHSLIIKSTGADLTDRQVIFDNGNHLDCRKANLKVVTLSEKNARNGLLNNNASGYKGVSRASQNNTWDSKIMVKGKWRYLGSYATPQEAARAYNEEALKLYGEGVYLNPV